MYLIIIILPGCRLGQRQVPQSPGPGSYNPIEANLLKNPLVEASRFGT